MSQEDIRDRTQRRVVCAALRKFDIIVIGARHYDPLMRAHIAHLGSETWSTAEQGFIDQHGKYMSREEAFEVATAAGQILEKTGYVNKPVLYSEDLY